MNFLKNIILLVVVLFLSYFTAEYFGSWYDKFSPQYSSFITSRGDSIFVVGLLSAYVFFITSLFGILGYGNKKRWIFILLIPAALVFVLGDFAHIYLSVIVGLTGFFIGKLLSILVSKARS